MYGNKIKVIRDMRGFPQAYLAYQLGISQNTYSKIETNQTKLSTEMLQKIATVLDVSPMDIISATPAIVNFQNGHKPSDYLETLITGQKDFFDKMLSSKDEEINRLQKIIEGLLDKRYTKTRSNSSDNEFIK